MRRVLMTLAILGLFAAPAFAQSMVGCTVDLIGPMTVNPGDTGVVFEFLVYNGTPDNEWVSDAVFTFPDCFTVTAGSYNDGGWGFVFNFIAAGNVATFEDGDGGWGEIYADYFCTFYVTVDVGADCPAGPATVHWFLQGDIFGADPHFLEGDVDFTIGGTATEASSWSSVKALY